jgi:hypothetical protein
MQSATRIDSSIRNVTSEASGVPSMGWIASARAMSIAS